MLVVDASIAFKWVFDERDTLQARSFYVTFANSMHAPDLLLIEFGGSLVRRVNEQEMRAESAAEVMTAFRARVEEGMVLHRLTPDLVALAAELAVALGHPLKDCIYLALADRLGCPLATADVKFRDRVRDPERVKLLSELA